MAIKPIEHLDVTIADSGTTTDAIDLDSRTLWGVIFPAAMTGTAISITVSDAIDGTYVATRNFANDGDYSVDVTASKRVPLDVRVTGGNRFIKVVSNDTEAAARTLILQLRENE